MIEIINWQPNGEIRRNLSTDDCRASIQQTGTLTWVDIYDEPNNTSEIFLQDVFRFHPLAIADAIEETHVPKIDDWGDYLYLVLRAAEPQPDNGTMAITPEVDIFIGQNFIVTYHLTVSQTIERVKEITQRENWSHEKGPAQILYLIYDETADNFISLADQMEIRGNRIEDLLFDHPESSLLEEIFALKRVVLELRQSIIPQREVLNKLARGDYKVLGSDSPVYFRDVYDHFYRLYDILENLRDLTSNTLEIFLSIVNNRMNGIMKTLTVITTLFMPISFLAGFFGMNFFKPVIGLPGWTSQPAFIIVLAATIAFPFSMLIYILRKGWMK